MAEEHEAEPRGKFASGVHETRKAVLSLINLTDAQRAWLAIATILACCIGGLACMMSAWRSDVHDERALTTRAYEAESERGRLWYAQERERDRSWQAEQNEKNRSATMALVVKMDQVLAAIKAKKGGIDDD